MEDSANSFCQGASQTRCLSIYKFTDDFDFQIQLFLAESQRKINRYFPRIHSNLKCGQVEP